MYLHLSLDVHTEFPDFCNVDAAFRHQTTTMNVGVVTVYKYLEVHMFQPVHNA